MRWLSRLIGGANALARTERTDRDLDDELRAYLETAVEEKMRRGLDREQAIRFARLELGLVSVESVKERVRDVGWETHIEGIWQDVQYALRGLRRAPGFTAAAVLSLAIGTGANVGIFSIIDHALFRPLPVPAPEQLVNLLSPGPKAGSTSGNSNLGPRSAIFSHPLFRDSATSRRMSRSEVRRRTSRRGSCRAATFRSSVSRQRPADCSHRTTIASHIA
jgi:hypothetical protein